jgi:CRP/FNR family transcriptional regulator, cyclic AMP receptor protein
LLHDVDVRRSMSMDAVAGEARRFVQSSELFKGVGPGGLDGLIRAVRLKRYESGETVFSMGDSSGFMLAVVTGCVQISIPSADGKEIILAIMKTGDIFGEIGLLDGKERTADARATTAACVAVLDRRDVLKVLESDPKALMNVVTLLCERLRRTTVQVADVALLDVPTRLAKLLVRMVRVADIEIAGQHPAVVSLSQRELGNLVGATRESVNKCLRGWQEAGIVKVDNNRIKITKPAALLEYAGDEV